MTERVHYHSWPLDRAFTFKEWCDYLHEHPDSIDEPVYEEEGFVFNVHGACLNPHKVHVAINPQCYYDLRTFIKQGNWNFGLFSINSGAHGFGPVEGGEQDAIRAGYAAALVSIRKSLEWAETMHRADIETWGEPTCNHGADAKRYRAILALTEKAFDEINEPTLF